MPSPIHSERARQVESVVYEAEWRATFVGPDNGWDPHEASPATGAIIVLGYN